MAYYQAIKRKTYFFFMIAFIYLIGHLGYVSAGWVNENIKAQTALNESVLNVTDISGNLIVYEDNRMGNSDVWLYDITTGQELQITDELAPQFNPQISGNRIIWDDGRLGNPDWNVYLFDIDLLNDGNPITEPERRISPVDGFPQAVGGIDGDRIVFTDWRHGGSNTEIYLFNLSTGTEQRITTNNAQQRNPQISGGKIVWIDQRNDVNWDIYMYDASTGLETAIASGVATQLFPDISGDKVTWKEGSSIIVLDLTTGARNTIKSCVAATCRPRISGNRVVYSDEIDGDLEVFMYDLETSQEIRITNNGLEQSSPAVSGTKIAWRDSRGGNYDLYYADALYQEDLPPEPPDQPDPPLPPIDPEAPPVEPPITPVTNIDEPVQPISDPSDESVLNKEDSSELRQENFGNTVPSTRKERLKKAIAGFVKNPRESILLLKELATEIIKETPPPVAYSFPYLLFGLLGLLACRLLAQTKSEAVQATKLLEILKLEKIIAEEKENFLALSAHYLRTPLTLLKLGISVILDAQNALKKKIVTLVDSLDERVKKLLNSVEKNSYLSEIKKPDPEKEKIKIYSSPFLWLPLIMVAGIAVLANYLFERVANINIHTMNYLTEVIIFLLVAQFFIFSYRKRKNDKANFAKLKKAEDYEIRIDETRNQFIEKTALVLEKEIEQIIVLAPEIKGEAQPAFLEGSARFNEIVKKLKILKELRTGQKVKKRRKIVLKNEVERILAAKKGEYKSKKLSFSVEGEDGRINQNRDLVLFIVESLLDNAMKFSKEGGRVEISIFKDQNETYVTVKDNGIGISKEGMLRLFKPFSRATSALTFDYEGMGLSLYLSKISAEYMGGDIQIDSQKDNWTKVTFLAEKL